ncbi:MAG: cyclic nucleotide-binding domain-containing protein, partial [Acutalibacteraceae bacterium]|nr:cyclic nucleotide-binding domain-containing protein [Acutalibacteraceae bacterium]
MKEYISILKRTQLFAGVVEEEISAMLSCLGARLETFKKGEYVLRQGEHLSDIVVLVVGNLHIKNDDYWGNRSILGQIAVGDMFGEAYVAPESGALLNDVVAIEDSSVIFFDVKRILTTCSSACRFHAMVVQNLFFAISEKNRKLVQKLGHMSKR